MALVGWWPLDGNTDDYSVNNNTGVNTNVTFVNGKIGQAGSFNGTSSFVDIPNSPALNPLKKLSLAFWVYTNETPNGSEKNFIDKNGYFQYRIGLLSNGTRGVHSTIQVTNGTTSTFINGYGGAYILPLQTWVHLSYIVDLDAKKISLYVNGVLHNSLNITTITGDLSMVINSNNLWLGRFRTVTTYFDGFLNDVRIYNHALSQKEINELAKAKILHYTFNKDESIVYDGSGFKRNATKGIYPPVISSDSKLGTSSFLFPGSAAVTDDVLVVNNSGNFIDGNNGITMSAWINLNSRRATHETFIGKGVHSPGSSYSLLGISSNKVGVRFRGLSTQDVSSTTTPPLNTWFHLATTYNGSQVKIYYNGTLETTQNVTGTITNNLINLYIGTDNARPQYTVDGKMDDVRIYGTALSDADILDMYQTRAKVDNQGNLYANEFVEDYEVASGVTLNQLFKNNNIISNSSFEVDSNSDGLADSWNAENTANYQIVGNYKSQKMSSGTTFGTFRLTQALSTLPITGNIYYYNMNIKERVNISGSSFQISSVSPSYIAYYGPSVNLGFNSFRQTFPTFDRNNARIQVNFDFNTSLYLNGLAYMVIDDITMINLTASFGAGNEPTQAQMDIWYRDYIQSRTKSNGQIITNEFSEVDSSSQEMKIFKDKIHIQGSLNEGGQ